MSLINVVLRSTLQPAMRSALVRSLHTGSTHCFHYTPVLCAEPLKKKKKIDPQVLKQREERKRKRLEKMIRRLEKNARQLKPVEELEVPIELLDEQDKRKRTGGLQVSEQERESRILLEKQWAKYKMEEKLAYYQLIDRVLAAQTKALNELRLESEALYQQAIQPDLQQDGAGGGLLPLKTEGPVSTPPVAGYEMPDGEYIDVSKKWE
ncbi:39S ribosomal protein L40, mitochondrial [Sabethes cyaneus]|uniref:39S ribosomal protein L40, mitochondrial n=1 Tax=Sabethes cyaneus TaxID=53552 RepID=UPI00237DDE4D|nr:39S ribosomal protein L40, mitochondrial [Sabethes cyaneus]